MDEGRLLGARDVLLRAECVNDECPHRDEALQPNPLRMRFLVDGLQCTACRHAVAVILTYIYIYLCI